MHYGFVHPIAIAICSYLATIDKIMHRCRVTKQRQICMLCILSNTAPELRLAILYHMHPY